MLRRNGKPTSCEPCRLAKVRCDHATPVCRRCQSRGSGSQCYYHPAPLTRPKAQVGQPRRRSRRTPTGTVERQSNYLTPPSLDTASPDSSHFLGSTSYLSVFKEPPSWVSKTSSRSLQPEFEHWRTDHAFVAARLVRLISAVDFYHEQITWYYNQGPLSTVPALLVLGPLQTLQSFLKRHPWDSDGDWKAPYEWIMKNTASPLQTGHTSAKNFYLSFTGENLRWEFVGFMFALAGIGAVARYSSHHTLDLGTGEQMNVDMFAKEMVLACNACLDLCRSNDHVNDVTIWMRHALVVIGFEVLGATSSRVYHLLGDMVSDIYIMGMHHQGPSGIPLYLSETRKRVLAAIHRADKNVATMMGRPPRLPYQYCNSTLPIDVSDADLVREDLDPASSGLDEAGWNLEGCLHPATMIRLRHILSNLREKVIELSLGYKTGPEFGDRLLHMYQECQQTLDAIPLRLRYTSACWQQNTPFECLASMVVQGEYLFSVFHLQRIRCQESPTALKDLLDTSMEILSIVMDFARYGCQEELRKEFPLAFLIYGVPSTGVLVTELHRHTFSSIPLPSTVPRSEIIRNLSFIISWFRTADLPSSTTHTTCLELINVISRLLDDTLNYQPTPRGTVQALDMNTINDNSQEQPSSTTLMLSDLFGTEYDNGMAGEGFMRWLDDSDLDARVPNYFF